ncbi:MAG TPA: MFS transporter [Ramlibacter sp.]|jgi:predicted MFS family arabinose efflux permease
MSAGRQRSAWLMLLVLISGFALSQAFRTVAAIMAPPLQQEFGLTPQALGVFAGSFHFAFGSLQLFMGMGLDVYGPRRTVLAVFPLAIAGAVVTAMAPSFGWLVAGQVLTGIGCAPAFLACTVFIARRFESGRFASVNGMAMGIGSIGLLATGTPLAWIIEGWSWRAGFLVLAACAAVAWVLIWRMVREEPRAADAAPQRLDVRGALRGYAELFRLPHTLGIIALALFTYAAFLSLRGLWLGPLLIDRYGFSLVHSGHVAFAVSATGIFAPPLFGRLDPGDRTRRRWILGFTLACALLFVVMALQPGAWIDVAAALAIGVLSGFITMQYADVRAAYPSRLTGRAMAVYTMALFLGVALMQWLTGLAASYAHAIGVERYAAVLAAIAFFLGLGALLFRVLPQPTPLQQAA